MRSFSAAGAPISTQRMCSRPADVAGGEQASGLGFEVFKHSSTTNTRHSRSRGLRRTEFWLLIVSGDDENGPAGASRPHPRQLSVRRYFIINFSEEDTMATDKTNFHN